MRALDLLRPTEARVIGVLAAFGLLGLLMLVPRGIAFELPMVRVETGDPDESMSAVDAAFVAATFVLAGPLAWLFANGAARPGWRAAFATALGFSVVAVVLGSFLVAGLLAPGAGLSEWFAGTVIWGAVGVLFLGPPMTALVFILSLSWVGVVRLIAMTASSVRLRTG